MSEALTPDISPIHLRGQLVKMVLDDLRGPAGGANEVIDENSVRDRYLVGMLAPKKQYLTPEEDDSLELGGTDTTDDGKADSATPSVQVMFPSSFGMTFCGSLEATEFQVTASWGQYAPEPRKTPAQGGRQSPNVWRRHPRQGVCETIRFEEGKFERIPDPECPQVVVQGRIRRRADHWSVTVFLVNEQDEPKRSRDKSWLFQPKLVIKSPDGVSIFTRRPILLSPGLEQAVYDEQAAMAMLYRHQVEFAAGHGVSVHVTLADGKDDKAVQLETEVAPQYEVPKTTPPTPEDFPLLADLVVDMKELAETPQTEMAAKLAPLLTAYDAWITEREQELEGSEFDLYRDAGEQALQRCREALRRIRAGIDLIGADEQAFAAFQFANKAMWLQRVRSIYAQRRRRGEEVELAEVDIPKNHSWYPFQLAFVLLNLPGITRLDHDDRSSAPAAIADLLWFPTGGGKTEAYLGLSAYTLAIRRLQGTVENRGGQHGVAVLMRYTLRLLTIQQFQRASTLICACESIRREAEAAGDNRWGEEPFRIGLWVGQRVTPNTTEQSQQWLSQNKGGGRPGTPGSGSPAQLTNCPWCGSKLEPGRDMRVESFAKGRARTLVFCSDPMGRCLFSPQQSKDEGIPVVVVDEEIYRRLPGLVIATVDKFAQMPWNGKVQMLFGQVDGYCERHGFRSPEIEEKSSHQKKGAFPATEVKPHPPLRPPDLIIQDELHLISGPLGTMVGIYETAVDKLCSWTVEGKTVRPKVIASTATIRKAGDQINALFLRTVNVFPPHGLDVRDNFFSLQRVPSEDEPGRLYLGICAPGRRLKVALIRVYVAFLAAAQQLYEERAHGKDVDPWMTLVGYFNSMRELGGMRRLVDDDVRTRLGKINQRGLTRRSLYEVQELTSRKSSAEIPEVLDRLEVPFDLERDALRKELQAKRKFDEAPARAIDVLLATNMVSVGVDVPRLGLMVTAGQPKTTAEYIQATSRVGRRAPGIVCTVYNWARPRDLSHYETFSHYHATFYKHVEALSVTPFSSGAISRGLTALLVSYVRLQGKEFNANDQAGRVDRHHPYFDGALKAIEERALLIGDGLDVADLVKGELKERVDDWLSEAQRVTGGAVLGYKDQKDGRTRGMLKRPGADPWDNFTCLNSLRDVEPSVGLILADGGLDDVPDFDLAVSDDSDADEDDQ